MTLAATQELLLLLVLVAPAQVSIDSMDLRLESTTLTDESPAPEDKFGLSLDVLPTHRLLLVGAPRSSGFVRYDCVADDHIALFDITSDAIPYASIRNQHPTKGDDDFGRVVVGITNPNGEAWVVVGAPAGTLGYAAGGAVQVISVEGHRLLWEARGAWKGDGFGSAIAPVGDISGDGHADLAVGAPSARISTGVRDATGAIGGEVANESGTVFLLSGRDGAVLGRLDGAEQDGTFGHALANVGDLDGDGMVELLVGAPASHAGYPNAGLARIVSIPSGRALREVCGEAKGDELGRVVSALPDLDHDSIPEYAITTLQDYGAVLVYSGSDGSLILRLESKDRGRGFGQSVSSCFDVDGDGMDDIAVGDPHWSSEAYELCGAVHFFSGASGSYAGRFEGASRTGLLGWSVRRLVVRDSALDLLFAGAPGGPHGRVVMLQLRAD